MEDLLKKFLYTGVGLVAVTAEKLQSSIDKLISEGKLSIDEGKKVIDKLVKEGKLSADEGKKVIDDLVKKGKLSAEEGRKTVEEFLKNAGTKRDEVESQIKSITERIISNFEFATKKEVADLKKKVTALEAKLKTSAKPVRKKAPVKPKATKPESV